MYVLRITAELLLPSAGSLKDKRQVVKSAIQRLRGKLNVSVAETDYQENWQRSQLGLVFVGSDCRILEQESVLARKLLGGLPEAELVDFWQEYLQ